MAVKSIHAAGEEGVVDMVEVMPGVTSTALCDLCNTLPVPVIAGGLIHTKEELGQTLAAGVRAVSTGEPSLWTASIS